MRSRTPYDFLAELLNLAPHRLTGSPEAAIAREWIADQLRAAGLRVEVEPFDFKVANHLAPLGTMANAWGTVAIGLTASMINPWIGLALLAAVNVLDFWLAPKLFRTATMKGANVFAGVGRPWSDVLASPRPVLLVTSHLDTAKAEPPWLRRILVNSDTYFSVAVGGLVALVLYLLANGILPWVPTSLALLSELRALWDSVLRWVILLLGLPIVLSSTLWVLRRFFSRGLLNPGADDNASGVAVTLSLIEALRDLSQETQMETAVAFFDAEESGLRGSRDFVSQYRRMLHPENTTILNLDCVGRAGSSVVVRGQGLLRQLRANDEIVGLWHQTCEREHVRVANIWFSFVTGGTDQAAWLNLGFSRALTVSHGHLQPKRTRTALFRLLGIPVDPVDIDWAHLHSPNDTLDAISVQALETTQRAAIQFARALAMHMSKANGTEAKTS